MAGIPDERQPLLPSFNAANENDVPTIKITDTDSGETTDAVKPTLRRSTLLFYLISALLAVGLLVAFIKGIIDADRIDVS